MNKLNRFWEDTGGDAVVEASILFPIIIMIFAGLVLLSMYMPTQAALQRATQYTATAIATERSDTWLFYDENSENDIFYRWADSKEELSNVYVDVINSVRSGNDGSRAEAMVRNVEKNGISSTEGDLIVEYGINNYGIYKEIIVTATRMIPMPVDLSFVGFPVEIPITVTSTAVVQNGDEFVRNIDIAGDLLKYADEKYSISENFESVGKFLSKFGEFMGW